MTVARFPFLAGSILIVASLYPACAQGQEPQLTSIFPLGGQRGTTVEAVIAGTNLEDVRELFFAHSGITARLLKEQRFAITLAPDVPEGDYDVWAITGTGLSNPRRFTVGGQPEINEKEKNDDPQSAQVVKLPVVINGTIQPGTDRDYYRLELTRGQRLTLSCRSETLEGTVQPALTVYGPDGRELLHDRGRSVEPTLDFQAPENGSYLVRVEERAYRGDAQSGYRLTLFSGPRLVGAFPQLLSRGQTQTVTLYGYELPGGKPAGAAFPTGLQQLEVSVTAPAQGDADGGGWTLSSAAMLDGFRYRHPGVPGVLRFGLANGPVTVESAALHSTPATAQAVTLPAAIAGRFLQPREVDWYRFSAKKGQILWIEAVGERDGPAMDLDVAIHGAQGKVLERFTDTIQPKDATVKLPVGTLDPMGVWKAPADGDYFLVIRDLYGTSAAGVERTYRLFVGPQREEVRVVAVQGSGSPRGLGVKPGGSTTLQLFAIRHGGHQAPIRIHAVDLPAGLEAKETVIAAKQLTGTWTLTAVKDAAPWIGKINLVAETEIDGKRQTLPVMPLTTVREGATPLVRRCDGLLATVVGGKAK